MWNHLTKLRLLFLQYQISVPLPILSEANCCHLVAADQEKVHIKKFVKLTIHMFFDLHMASSFVDMILQLTMNNNTVFKY